MRTGKSGRILYVLVFLTVFIGSTGRQVSAQHLLDLPQQSSQGQAPFYSHSTDAPTPIPQLPPRSGVRILPQISPQPPAAPSSKDESPLYRSQPQPAPRSPQVYHSQPVLPAVFRGCWKGRVDYLDSVQRLPGGAKLGFWTPKIYQLCYRRIGDGPFVLTFTEAGIEQSDRIINAEGQMMLLSSDGRRYASMRSELNFDEYPAHSSYFGNNTFPVHEVADLNCSIEPDGMHVNGIVTGWRNGAPWFRARWHTILVHESQPSQQVQAPPGGIPE